MVLRELKDGSQAVRVQHHATHRSARVGKATGKVDYVEALAH
jgi:hypothetical protein